MDDFDRAACLGRLLHAIPASQPPSIDRVSRVKLVPLLPGEFQASGHKLLIKWGAVPCPFGPCSIGWNAHGICHLAFLDIPESIPRELEARWPNATFQQDDSEAARWIKRIFYEGLNGAGPLEVFVRATPFQHKVWRALLRIPEGRIASYQAVACAIGSPKACRAVGTACSANPVAYLIPCHRVVHGTGDLRGYRWGDERKRNILFQEFDRVRRASGGLPIGPDDPVARPVDEIFSYATVDDPVSADA